MEAETNYICVSCQVLEPQNQRTPKNIPEDERSVHFWDPASAIEAVRGPF